MSKMKPEEIEIITPSPFFKIKFGCNNRQFYNVKGELYAIAEKIGIEIEDGYIEETCDYEGDLDEILIYNCERAELLIKEVLEFYDIPLIDLPPYMNVQLSIF